MRTDEDTIALDLHRADTQTKDATPIDDGFAGAVVGRGRQTCNESRQFGVFVAVVSVDDDMNNPAGGNPALERVEEMDELLQMDEVLVRGGEIC